MTLSIRLPSKHITKLLAHGVGVLCLGGVALAVYAAGGASGTGRPAVRNERPERFSCAKSNCVFVRNDDNGGKLMNGEALDGMANGVWQVFGANGAPMLEFGFDNGRVVWVASLREDGRPR